MTTTDPIRARFTRFWTIADHPPTDPQCFIVPSYALKDATRPIRPTCAEIDLAVAWWRRFPDAMIVMCTGDNQQLGITNARAMAEYAESLGVPTNRLIEEDRSVNTWENLRYAAEIMDKRSLRRPTIVALDLYMRRVVATARKSGWKDFAWLSAFSTGEPAHGIKRFQTYSRATIFCYELMAMVYARLVGWA
jgi:uncharacterized SAM-binding protein YcdF (DUF218 family)